MTLYTWDEAKRISNLRKHGLDFADARSVLAGQIYVREDTRFRYSERRYNAFGWLGLDIACITYTETKYGLRIISFRKASRQEVGRLVGRNW